jgi:hypothetical protein
VGNILVLLWFVAGLGSLWFMLSELAFKRTELELRVRIGEITPWVAAISLDGRACGFLVAIIVSLGTFARLIVTLVGRR